MKPETLALAVLLIGVVACAVEAGARRFTGRNRSH